MLLAAMRDMQWRKRRFVIAVLSTAIIFAMTLVLTGLANGFQAEAQRPVDSLGEMVACEMSGNAAPSSPDARATIHSVDGHAT